MTKFIKKLKYLGLISIFLATNSVLAVNITVPSAPSQGFLLQSTSTGAYLPVSLIAGSNVTISTTTSSITISSSGGGSTWPFTVDSYGGLTVQSTTTGLWLKDLTPYSLIASSTLFTYASTTQLDVTGTATSTFGGGINLTTLGSHITAHGLRSDASDGLHFHANNWTDVAIFGAGNSSNVTFYGGVNIDGTTRLATGLTGILKATAGSVSTASNGTDYTLITANTCAAGQHFSQVTAGGTFTCTADTGSSGGSGNVATSTNETSGRLAYWTTTSGTPAKLGDVSTTTLTLSGFPANIPSTLGNLVGGSNTTWTWWGLATTSQPSSSNLLVSNGGQGVYGVSTSTLTASSPLTGSFVQIGSGGSIGCQTASSAQAGCLSAAKFSQFDSATTTAGTGLTYSGNAFNVNTTQNITNLSGLTTNGGVYTTGGNGTLNAVATSTATVSTGLSYSGTMGSMFGGTSGNITLNMANANSWTALQTFANSSTTLGSFTYASTTELRVGTGQGIAYVGSNGKLGATATSTFSLSQFTNDLAALTALDTTLTFSGSYNGSVSRTVGLNLGNANTWTALQTFGNSTTTYGSFTNASTTNLFVGTGQGLLYTGSGQAVKVVATSTPTVTAPITYSGTLGSFVGGVAGAFDCTTASAVTKGCIAASDFSKFNSATTTFTWPLIYTLGTNAVTWGGLSTSSTPTLGQLPYWTGVNTFGSTATTSVTCTGSVSCSTFNVLGSSPITITGSGGTSAFEIATTSTISVPQLAYFTQATGKTTLGGVSTTTLSCGNGASCSTATILGSSPITITGLGNGYPGWATSTPYTGGLIEYPIQYTTLWPDMLFGASSTTTAPFWWDVSATSTYIGNGGVGTSSLSFSGSSLTNSNKFWNIGSYSSTQNGFGNFYISSSSSDTDMVTNQFFSIDQSGNVGIGSSTPWGLLSVQPITTSYINPLFHVATSSTTYGDSMFSIFATTTNKIVQSITGRLSEMGVRIGVGVRDYLGYGGLLDQFVVRGRTNDVDWLDVDCDGSAAQAMAALAADGFTGCNGFTFAEDNTGTLTATTPTGGGATFSRLAAAVNADGAGVFITGASAGWLTLATSTPVLETSLRIRNSTATTSQYYIGFTNIAQAGTTYETEPTQGCYFVASSTTANWRAICRTNSGGANMTLVDTGIASTSVTNGANGTGYQFRKFRIEADSTKAEFYIQSSEASNLTKVATISTTYPSTQLLNAGIHYGIQSINTNSGMDFFRTRFWWRDNLPQL